MKKLVILLLVSCTTSLSMCLGVEPLETAPIEHINPGDLTALQNRLNELRREFDQPDNPEVLVAQNNNPDDDDAHGGALIATPPVEPTIILGESEPCPGVGANLNHVDNLEVFMHLPLEAWAVILSFLPLEDVLQVALAFSIVVAPEFFEIIANPNMNSEPHRRVTFYEQFLHFVILEMNRSINRIEHMYRHICLLPDDPLIEERARLLNQIIALIKAMENDIEASENTRSVYNLISNNPILKAIALNQRKLLDLKEMLPYGGISLMSSDNKRYFFKPNTLMSFVYLLASIDSKNFRNNVRKGIGYMLQELLFIWVELPEQFREDNPFLSIIFDQFGTLIDPQSPHDSIMRILTNSLYRIRYKGSWMDPNMIEKFFLLIDHNGLSPVCYALRALMNNRLSLEQFLSLAKKLHLQRADCHVTRERLTLVEYAATLLGEGLTQEVYDAIVEWHNNRIREERERVPIVPVTLIPPAPQSHFYRNTAALSVFVLLMSVLFFNTYS